MIETAVLIPCFNEAETIDKVVIDFRATIPETVIYVYDNNSTDHTDEKAKTVGGVIRYEYHQGKGNVIRLMFAEIDAECYILVDGDDTYPAQAAREMRDRVLMHQADMVVGDRLSSTYFRENKRPFHGLGNRLVRRCINVLFNTEIKDIMTGYRAFEYPAPERASRPDELCTVTAAIVQYILRYCILCFCAFGAPGSARTRSLSLWVFQEGGRADAQGKRDATRKPSRQASHRRS